MAKYILTIVSILLIIPGWAKHVNPQQAEVVARQFMLHNTDICKAQSDVYLAHTFKNDDNGEDRLYIFNIDNIGFVIVSADDVIKPVLGYSTEADFSSEDISPEFLYWIDSYSQTIDYYKDNNLKASEAISQQWYNVIHHGYLEKITDKKAVDPLCRTIWGQAPYFNDLCPKDENGKKAVTGCVATAMGQILKYWNYPPIGEGEHAYAHYDYGGLYVNYGEAEYDFMTMPNALDASSSDDEVFEIAQLLYHLGVSVDMNYGPDASGANSIDVPVALRSHYFISCDDVVWRQTLHDDAQWGNMIKECLNDNIPVYYAGSGHQGGHAFVCDGYDYAGFFHFNWGWRGAQNNYFAIDSTFEWKYNQEIILNIKPLYPSALSRPDEFEVDVDDNYASVELSWINPSTTADCHQLDKDIMVYVKMNDEIIQTFQSHTGDTMELANLPIMDMGYYTFEVYATTDDTTAHVFAAKRQLYIGPSCDVKMSLYDKFGDGWNGAAILVNSDAGVKIGNIGLNNGAEQDVSMEVPIDKINFTWQPGNDAGVMDKECAFKIYNKDGEIIYWHKMGTALDSGAVFFTFELTDECETINLGMQQITDDNSIYLLPNPADEYFIINENNNVDKVEIFNVEGKLTDVKSCRNDKIDCSKYDNGIYFVRMYMKNNVVINKKLVVQH